jgi:hypothetical protein
MSTDMLESTSVTVNASAAATGWINAFLATSQDPEGRQMLYRTLSVELYQSGVQFVATDGTILFRTWVPIEDAEWPEQEESPEAAVVVMDGGHFALSFIKTLLAATKTFETAEISLTVEDAPEDDGEIPLGAAFSPRVLTLRALGQQTHCRLFDDKYVDWRKLNFGVEQAERVDGMKISTRMFATCGRLKGVGALEMTFSGEERAVILTSDSRSFRGIMMPMRRKEKDEKPAPEPDGGDEQADILDQPGNTFSVNGGEPVPATRANMKREIEKSMRATSFSSEA